MGRWVLLGLLGAQLVAIGISLALRCCLRGRHYSQFEDEEAAAYHARQAVAAQQMEQLKAKVLGEQALGGVSGEDRGAAAKQPTWQRAGSRGGAASGSGDAKLDGDDLKIPARSASKNEGGGGGGGGAAAVVRCEC